MCGQTSDDTRLPSDMAGDGSTFARGGRPWDVDNTFADSFDAEDFLFKSPVGWWLLQGLYNYTTFDASSIMDIMTILFSTNQYFIERRFRFAIAWMFQKLLVTPKP